MENLTILFLKIGIEIDSVSILTDFNRTASFILLFLQLNPLKENKVINLIIKTT